MTEEIPAPLVSKKPEVLIQFLKDEEEHKVVEMKGTDGTIYVASYPSTHVAYHMDVLLKASEALKQQGKKVVVAGGGFLKRQGNSVSVYGESQQFGPFDAQKVAALVTEAFPDLTITHS